MLESGIVPQIIMDAIYSDGVVSHNSVFNIINCKGRHELGSALTICDGERILECGVGRSINPVSLKGMAIASNIRSELIKETFCCVVPIQRYFIISRYRCKERSRRRHREAIIILVCLLSSPSF